MRSSWGLFLTAFLFMQFLVGPGEANATDSPPSFREINNNVAVVLPGNVHPLARSEMLAGATDPTLPMERMILSLRLSSNKQAAMEKFLAEQHDTSSPNYHLWLSPEEFGARFAPQPDEIATITAWLTSQGFTIDEVAKGKTWINFSGTVSKVETAFHTQMRDYYVNGKIRHANAIDPAIPLAIADLVSGIVSLHNIPETSMVTREVPDYTSGSSHYMSPSDFATIYNVNPIYAAGIDGTGQSIAIVGRTHPSSSNWASFRSTMGLPANPPVVIVNGPDPGDLGADEDGEADLDVEWSGAVAKGATIKFVVSSPTNSSSAAQLSAQYIINNNLAPVMSTSFGLCEWSLGSTWLSFYNLLWAQAAAQGITSFVSSGDAGAAGCNGGGDSSGSSGLAVSGVASTPYNVAVGGTQFNEGSGNYWNSTNAIGYASAKSYIPEVAWNESGNMSGGSGLWASGGGASAIYSKPSWQVAPGVPADGKRDIPDVSLSASSHNGYLVTTKGAMYVVSGTSASTPAFAGLMALIVQKTGQRQGNANPRFYQLANAQYLSGGTTVFHDITSGNNSVPGLSGFPATPGYDLVTGLGSVDASALLNNWAVAVSDPVLEFYNTNLDHYFLTPDPNEAAGIDGGSAGPGWIRTGYTFNSGGSTPVCRFYGSMSPGPNSHFYTVSDSECSGLKQLQAITPDTQKRWNFEGVGFFSTPPANGACPGGTAPVYRAYNNGFARGVDSNHRITSSLTAIQEVVNRGWISEGVVMCAPS